MEGEVDMYGAKDVLDQLDVPLGEVKATASEYVAQIVVCLACALDFNTILG